MEPAAVPLEVLLTHRAWVRRVARALVLDDSRADDLEQEVWLRSILHPPRKATSLRGWLGTVLRHAASDMRRSESARSRHEGSAAGPAAEPAPRDIVAEADLFRRVADAVMRLEEPARTTILLRYFDDLPATEIAARQGIPVETVRTRLKRGVARLRALLGTEDGDRRTLALLLVPVLHLPRPAAAPAPVGVGLAGAVAGGVLVGMKAKGAAAAIVLVAGLAGWFAMTGEEQRVQDGSGGSAASIPAESAPAVAPPTSQEVTRPAVTPTGPVLAGLVLTPGGSPVAGARVAASPDCAQEAADPSAEGGSVISGPDGAFLLPVPEDGGFFDLTATAKGWSPATLRGVGAGDSLRLILREEAVLSGRVLDLEGAPVPGATVRWLGTLGMVRCEISCTSGPDGAYRLAGIPGREDDGFLRHWVEAEAAGFAPQLVDAGQASWDGPAARRLDLWMLRGAVLKGLVVDAEDGRPLPGARVALWTDSASTSIRLPDGSHAPSPYWQRRLGEATADAAGSFRFENVPAWGVAPTGIHTPSRSERMLGFLGAQAEGYAPLSIRVRVPRDGETVVMDIPCWAEATVEGRVVDGAGEPVEGAQVFHFSEERQSWGLPAWFGATGRPSYRTDAEGRYRIGWIPAPRRAPGTIALMARGPGQTLVSAGPSVEVAVTGGAVTLVPDLVLGDGPGAPCIDVLAEDGEGRPLEGVAIRRWSTSEALARTDGEGRARVLFPGQETGAVALHLSRRDLAASRAEEALPSEGEPPLVRVVLGPGHRISGRVVRPDGTPVAGAGVTAAPGALPVESLFSGDQGWGEGGWRRVSMPREGEPDVPDLGFATADASGAFSIGNLPAGPVHLCAWKYPRGFAPGGPAVPLTVVPEVEAGTGDLVLVLDAPLESAGGPPTPLAQVEGLVRDAATGRPILKYTAWMNGEGSSVWSRAVAPGRFRFAAVPAGTWTLMLSAEGYDDLRREGIVVGPDGTTEPLDIVLDAGATLRGLFRFPPGGENPAVRLLLQSRVSGVSGKSADPGPDGRFEIRGLRRGAAYEVILVEMGAAARGKDRSPRMWIPTGGPVLVLPAEGDPPAAEWDLLPVGCLYVTISGPGFPIQGLEEEATAEQKRTIRETELIVEDASGRVVFRDDLRGRHSVPAYLPPGEYVVRVVVRGGEAASRRVETGMGLLRVGVEVP